MAGRIGSSGASGAADADAAIDLAEAALDSGTEADALPRVVAAAGRHPDNASLWQWTALLHRALDQHEQALAAFQKAARLAPADPLIAHSVARTALEAGLPALPLYERAFRLAPNNGELLLGRAAARCATGDFDTAIAELDAILAANPLWLQGHELAAQLRWMSGRRAAFTETIERALARLPREAGLWQTLLTSLIHADRFEDARAAAERARRAIGDHVVVLANEAAALSELRRDAEADALFARLAGHPDISIAVRHIRHLLRTGRPHEAARRAEPLVAGADANLIWPYLSLAWRILGDERWSWLEGDPCFIRTFDIAAALPPRDELRDMLRELHRVSAQPLDQSLRGGSQTDGNLFQQIDPRIRQLRAAIAEAVAAYVGGLPPRDESHPLLRHRRDRPVRFSGAWSVRLTDAGFHASHNHPAGWISSALYVALPPPTAGAAEDAGWIRFGVPQAELGLDLDPIRTVKPEPGTLVLFPSTMWHGTVPFPSGERITVAFDVAPPRP